MPADVAVHFRRAAARLGKPHPHRKAVVALTLYHTAPARRFVSFGESGCGKYPVERDVGLLPPNRVSIRIRGQRSRATRKTLTRVRILLQMIFQYPTLSLNPLATR